jgi:N-acetylglucosamine-6-phosphate deacetylase
VNRFVIGPAAIALGDGSSIEGRIVVENGRVSEVLASDGATDHRLPPGTHVAPGLIDIHTNGAGEFLFNRDQGYAVPVAAVEYARQGTTGFVAGIMTAPWESMLHAADEIVEAAHQLEEDSPRGARCLGIHFEGRSSIRSSGACTNSSGLFRPQRNARARWSRRAKARA